MSWSDEIDEVDAILMCAAILADYRLIGLEGERSE